MRDESEPRQQPENTPEDSKPGFWAIVASTLAAAFGVQSNKNRERDFKHGNFWVFVAAGLIFTLLFIATVMTIVRLVLRGAA